MQKDAVIHSYPFNILQGFAAIRENHRIEIIADRTYHDPDQAAAFLIFQKLSCNKIFIDMDRIHHLSIAGNKIDCSFQNDSQSF